MLSVCRVHEWGLSEPGLSWPAITVLFISKWTAWRCGQGHHRPGDLPRCCSDGHTGHRSRGVTTQFLLRDGCRPTRRRMQTTSHSPRIPRMTEWVSPPFCGTLPTRPSLGGGKGKILKVFWPNVSPLLSPPLLYSLLPSSHFSLSFLFSSSPSPHSSLPLSL